MSAITAGFAREIRARGHRADLVLLAAVPVVLVGLFALPEEARLGLAFSGADPTLATAFASHFVHLAPAHLLSNLAGYLLLAPLAYLLCLLTDRRWLFYTAFATFLLAFPLALSVLELAVGNTHVALGFSAINGAFFGLFSFALAQYAGSRLAGGHPAGEPPVAFFLGAALIAVLAVPSTVLAIGIAAAALLSAALYLDGTHGGGLPSLDGVRRVAARPGHFELASAGTGVFLAYPLVAFPTDPVTAAGVVNLYSHLLGFALAFVATYATVHVVEDGRVET